MLRVHVLGSGNALAGSRRDTTALAVQADGEWTVLDCPGALLHKLALLGADLAVLRRLIVTHNHVDHVYGFAHLAHALVLAPDRPPLEVHAPEETLQTLRAMLGVHGLDDACVGRLDLCGVPLAADVEIDNSAQSRISASPAAHSRATLAVRFEHRGSAFVYASDTAPSDGVVALSAGVDLLLHDCAGLHRDRSTFSGKHSSARQAGEIAAVAGVGELRLIHIPESTRHTDADLVGEAREHFQGRVGPAADGDTYTLT